MLKLLNMKNLLFALMLLLSFNSFSQLAAPAPKINLNLPVTTSYGNNESRFTRPAMLLGGTTFIVAGLLAPPVMEGGSTTQKKSWQHQMHKIAPIASGCVVLVMAVAIPL